MTSNRRSTASHVEQHPISTIQGSHCSGADPASSVLPEEH